MAKAEVARLAGKRILVTGGAGFIGSAVCRNFVAARASVLNIDKLTYAADPRSLAAVENSPSYRFIQADIVDSATMASAFAELRPEIVLNLAAESHVDRSIEDAGDFIATNIAGTHSLLDAALSYWRALDATAARTFRFIQISTDEVFGSLGEAGHFDETSRYDPSSPYAASKAAGDHLVRAWHRTHGLPAIVANASNNYGPYQFPEKLIPLTIINALEGKPIDVYGDGGNVRDWLHVDDHVAALAAIAVAGAPGQTYAIGARSERSNLGLVRQICAELDRVVPDNAPHERLIRFVEDRPGHDKRYAIDPSRIERELGWSPRNRFEDGLRRTVDWYVGNREWWEPHRTAHPGDRLGLGRHAAGRSK